MFGEEAGWRLKQMRKLLGISLKDMAKKCGTTKKVMRRLESGRQMMTAEMLARACVELGISSDYALGLID